MKAYVLINASPGRALEVAKKMEGVNGISAADAITGEYDVIAKPRYYDDSYSRRELTWSPSVGSLEQDIPAMTPWLNRLPEVASALAQAPLQTGATSPPGR